eukprot:TRINITY_DN65218_c0_g1_i1.p1 TRINITY_DN65218_c0_g1~~TRINITY_DN65218_c0_g1_i1.p1  ORF type:complete len:605 (+),score=166.68 TRINITY_DN65218_c0_g1_i1:77-1891(+)
MVAETERPPIDTNQLVWDTAWRGRGWARTYVNGCLTGKCKVNSRVLRQLTDIDAEAEQGTEQPPAELDLSRAYIGRCGLGPLLPVIRLWGSLAALLLRGNGLDSHAAARLVDACMQHPSVTTIELADNPLYASAGAVLLRLARGNRRVVYIGLEETQVPAAARRKIEAQLQHNDAPRRQAAAAAAASEEAEKKEFVKLPRNPVALFDDWDPATRDMLQRCHADGTLRKAFTRVVGAYGRIAVLWAMEWGSCSVACDIIRRLEMRVFAQRSLNVELDDWWENYAAEIAAQNPPVLRSQIVALRRMVARGRLGPRPKQPRHPTADLESAALYRHIREVVQMLSCGQGAVSQLAAAALGRVEQWLRDDLAGRRELPLLCERARYCLMEQGPGMAGHCRRWAMLGGIPNISSPREAPEDAEAATAALLFEDVVDCFHCCQDDYRTSGEGALPVGQRLDPLAARREVFALMRSKLPPAVVDYLLWLQGMALLPNAQVACPAPPNPLAKELPYPPAANDMLALLYSWGHSCCIRVPPGRQLRGLAELAAWLRLQPRDSLEAYAQGQRPAPPAGGVELYWQERLPLLCLAKRVDPFRPHLSFLVTSQADLS